MRGVSLLFRLFLMRRTERQPLTHLLESLEPVAHLLRGASVTRADAGLQHLEPRQFLSDQPRLVGVAARVECAMERVERITRPSQAKATSHRGEGEPFAAQREDIMVTPAPWARS